MSSSFDAAATSSLLGCGGADPITVDTVEYDFENYALSHGIPDTLDPLPYVKGGSVFATGDEAEPVLTSAKHDPRLRTVVCRHWLRDLCMKGAACEFLHEYNLKKMPLCRHGERCKIKDCPFRHISEANRMECVFYTQGFCIHGPFCRYKHIRRPREDLPAVADFTLGLSQMQAQQSRQDSASGGGGDGGGEYRDGSRAGGDHSSKRPAPKPNEFYKISLCKHFMAGNCPFGENCHFAHGESELRQFPGKTQQQHHQNQQQQQQHYSRDSTGDTGAGGVGGHKDQTSSEDAALAAATSTLDYFQGGAAGGGKACPILEPSQAHYYVVSSAAQRDLALSTVRGEWYVQRKHAEQMNVKYDDGKGQVMLFFTVSESRHLQGAAMMTSMATYQSRADTPTDDNDGPFCYRIKVEWYRTTELPLEACVKAAPDLILPTTRGAQHCQGMSASTGEALMKLLWNAPLVTLYESWSDDENAPEPPAPEAILTDFRAPAPDEVAWPIAPGPGFIFGCSSDTMDESLGRGLLGLPSHMKAAASHIAPGSTIFLFNVTDRLMFGIFEALTPAIMDIVPTAFSRNPKATSSPFPVQIRVRVSLECPPLEDTDPVLNDILRNRKGRIGPVTHAQAAAIANVLASQCGALQYMIEYRRGLEAGEQVRAPPIALPPRKIRKVEKTTASSTSAGDEGKGEEA